MTETTTKTQVHSGKETHARPLVIDTDVHERGVGGTLDDLLPYLDPKWHRNITEWNYQQDRQGGWGVPTVGAGIRADTVDKMTPARGADLQTLRRQLFDEAGVSIAILTGRTNASTLHPAWPDFKTALMTAVNDWQIDQFLKVDTRLVGSIHVNAHDPEGAVREIERLASDPRMVQVMMYLRDQPYGEPRYHPIFEAAARNNLVVAFHQSGNAPTAFGYHSYYIEWKCLVPQAFMSTLISLIFNGVFDKFPTLKVIMVEGAFTWVPHIMSRGDQHLRQLRVEVPWVKRLPSEIVREQVRFSTQPMEEMTASQFMKYIDLMGSDELLCFSTDYPHWDFDSPAEALPPGLPDALVTKIMSTNALEFYGARLTSCVNKLGDGVQA
jgi:uncharacterized protein